MKTVRPFPANKSSSDRNKITLIHKNETIFPRKDVAEVFSTFLVNAISNLGTVVIDSLLGNTGETNDLIVNITERHKTPPSIRLVKEHAS